MMLWRRCLLVNPKRPWHGPRTKVCAISARPEVAGGSVKGTLIQGEKNRGRVSDFKILGDLCVAIAPEMA